MDTFAHDVAGLRGEVGASEDVVGSISFEPIEISGVTFRFPEPVRVEAVLTNTGDGFLLYGSAFAEVSVQCSRCLSDVRADIAAALDTMFVDSKPLTPEEDQEIVHFDGDAVDVAPPVEAAVRLELPLAPLCDEECKGICASCGTDLNASECECSEQPSPESPFASLEGFFDDGDE
jgi:uncharacterized protein